MNKHLGLFALLLISSALHAMDTACEQPKKNILSQELYEHICPISLSVEKKFGHKHKVTCLALADDKRTLYSGAEYGTVCVWDILLNRCTETLSKHWGKVTFLELDKENLYSASSEDATICVWDRKKNNCLAEISLWNDEIARISSCLRKDNRLYVSFCPKYNEDKDIVRIWNMKNIESVATLHGEFPNNPKGVSLLLQYVSKPVSFNGQELYLQNHEDSESVDVWDKKRNTCLLKLSKGRLDNQIRIESSKYILQPAFWRKTDRIVRLDLGYKDGSPRTNYIATCELDDSDSEILSVLLTDEKLFAGSGKGRGHCGKGMIYIWDLNILKKLTSKQQSSLVAAIKQIKDAYKPEKMPELSNEQKYALIRKVKRLKLSQ